MNMDAIGHKTQIGRIIKVHGIDGVVIINPETGDEGFWKTLQIVEIKGKQGWFSPHRIEWVKPNQKPRTPSFFVKFEVVNNRSEALSLLGAGVFSSEVAQIKNESDNQESLEGYRVLDKDGFEGTVLKVEWYPAHPVMFISSKEIEFPIPFVDEFVSEVDNRNKRVYTKNITQFFELHS